MLSNGNRNRKTLLEISNGRRCAGRGYYHGKRVGKWSASTITYIRQKKRKIKYYLGQYLCSALQLLGGVGHRIGQWLHPALSLLPLRSQLGQSIWRREGWHPPRPAAPREPLSRIIPVTIAHALLVARSAHHKDTTHTNNTHF